MDFFIDLIAVADVENFFDRAFADQHVVAFVVDDDRHAPARKVEGDFVDFTAGAFDIQIGVRQDRPVQKVAQARLIVAVHVGVAQNVFAFAIGHVHVAFQNDLVLGERSGLVRAEDVHGAEILDGV